MMTWNSCVSGEALGTKAFTKKLSKKLYYKKLHARDDNYCAFYDLRLQVGICATHVMVIISTITRRRVCKCWGTRRALASATFFMIIGVGLIIFFQHMWTLIVGLILQSCGLGLTHQVCCLLYTSPSPRD